MGEDVCIRGFLCTSCSQEKSHMKNPEPTHRLSTVLSTSTDEKKTVSNGLEVRKNGHSLFTKHSHQLFDGGLDVRILFHQLLDDAAGMDNGGVVAAAEFRSDSHQGIVG